MIPSETLTNLKALWLNASKPPMVIAPLGTQRTLVQLTTLRPGALTVATFTQEADHPEKVAVFSAMDNAKFVMAAYEWVPKLIEEIVDLRNRIERRVVASGRDSAADPVAGLPGADPQPRARVLGQSGDAPSTEPAPAELGADGDRLRGSRAKK